jgi:hypothetical protein
MATAKQKDSATDSTTIDKPAEADTAARTAIGENFISVYRNYVDALREAHERAQQRYCEAQADHARAVAEVQFTSYRSREEAFRAYARSVQDAHGDDAYRVACEAEHRYGKALEEIQRREAKGLEEANRTAAAVLQAAEAEASKQREEARLTHSRGVQDGFARADPEALGPDLLALIGQSLLAASNYARPLQHQ